VREIPTDKLLVNQICQNAFHFIQVDRHAEPLETLGDVLQIYLFLPNYFIHAFEKITVANHFALFKK